MLDRERVVAPLFDSPNPRKVKARDLVFEPCDKHYAVAFCRRYHSRLPNTQDGPWQFAFHGRVEGITYVVALWNTPSSRSLPSHWLELRRLTCAPDAPRNTCSRFLAWMVRRFRAECPERERCMSYQDPSVHKGTIYKAAGWKETHRGVDRVRDRSGKRTGTDRLYRWNVNGDETDSVGKIRWEIDLC